MDNRINSRARPLVQDAILSVSTRSDKFAVVVQDTAVGEGDCEVYTRLKSRHYYWRDNYSSASGYRVVRS